MTYTVCAVLEKKDRIVLTLLPDGTALPNDKETVSLTFEDYASCGAPTAGIIVSEDDVERLRHGDRRYHALARALTILAAGDNSASLLFTKLQRRGIDRKDAAFAVRYALSHGILCENSQIERLVLRYAEEKLWGQARILPALEEKGYRTADILAVIAALQEDGRLNFDDIRDRLYEKSGVKSAFDQRKLAARHGFDVGNDTDF